MDAAAAERRGELGTFLRSRRAAVCRADHGLPPAARGAKAGLRREEVAFFSGVSMTWYTWLEQGRDITPSRQVLLAIAVALHLGTAEVDYVLSLAGYAPVASDALQGVALADHIQRFLDSLPESPAFGLTADWTIAGWNSAYADLFPRIVDVPPEDRNLLYLIYTDDSVRALLPDWESTSGLFLADFRASTARLHTGAGHEQLFRRLSAASPTFVEHWSRHDIGHFSSRIRRFRHPRLGLREYEQHLFRPSDQRDVELVIYRTTA